MNVDVKPTGNVITDNSSVNNYLMAYAINKQ